MGNLIKWGYCRDEPKLKKKKKEKKLRRLHGGLYEEEEEIVWIAEREWERDDFGCGSQREREGGI